jgi:hypothetical protein
MSVPNTYQTQNLPFPPTTTLMLMDIRYNPPHTIRQSQQEPQPYATMEHTVLVNIAEEHAPDMVEWLYGIE